MNCVVRKWGTYTDVIRFSRFCLKILSFDPGKKLGNQKHTSRKELWLGLWEYRYIPENTWHNYYNKSSKIKHFLEIQWGKSVSEHDIVRQL